MGRASRHCCGCFPAIYRPRPAQSNSHGRNLAGYPAALMDGGVPSSAQTTSLSFPFSVREVVLLGATVPGFAAPSARVEHIAAQNASSCGRPRAGLRDRLFTQLSGGERQRGAHPRAQCCSFAWRPSRSRGRPFCCWMEPTANLDFAHQAIVLREARQQARSGRAVLAILHDLNLAAAFADEIVLLSRGRIAGRGKAVEVMRDDLLSAVYWMRQRAPTSPRATGHRLFCLTPYRLSPCQ